jgi:hypothetical protein
MGRGRNSAASTGGKVSPKVASKNAKISKAAAKTKLLESGKELRQKRYKDKTMADYNRRNKRYWNFLKANDFNDLIAK